MGRRRLIIVLACLFSVLQFMLVRYWASLSTSDESPVSAPVGVAVNIVLFSVNVGVTRFILTSLERMRTEYADDITQTLKHDLETYRSQTLSEELLMRKTALEIDEEIVRADMALEYGDSDEASRRLRTSLDLASKTRVQTCEHVAVAAVLEVKSRQCDAAHVPLALRVDLPEQLPLPKYEVASIFFNLIDNALHECESLVAEGAASAPQIQVVAYTQAQQLFVQVSNSCRPHSVARRKASRVRLPTSTHGLGTGIVADIANRHGGIADFSEHDETFVAAVMIPLPEAGGAAT